MGYNGTWVKSVTVRDGSTNGLDWSINDTIIITNINASNETLELSGDILDASFINALNAGEEYILEDKINNSITDSSNALTAALTGGAYFEDATVASVNLGGTDGTGAEIKVTTTESGDNGVEPIVELKVTKTGSGYLAGEKLLIMNNYQIISKELTGEDANLLNGFKELRGNNYDSISLGNDNNNRKITSVKTFTDGAFGACNWSRRFRC